MQIHALYTLHVNILSATGDIATIRHGEKINLAHINSTLLIEERRIP
jgi:hypothetical protein